MPRFFRHKNFYKRTWLALIGSAFLFVHPMGLTQSEDSNAFSALVRNLVTQIEQPQYATSFDQLRNFVTASYLEAPGYITTLYQLKALEAQIEAAESGYYPTVQIQGAAGRKYTNSQSFPDNNYALKARQTLYSFGSTEATIGIATAKGDAGKVRIDDTRAKVVLDMVVALLEYQRAKRNVAFTQGFLVSQKDFVEKIRQRVELGASSEFDLRRSQEKLGNTTKKILAAQEQLRLAAAGYKSWFSYEPQFNDLVFRAPQVPNDSLSTADAVANHPDVREATSNYQAAIASLARHDAMQFGEIALTYEYSKTDINGATGKWGSTVGVIYSNTVFDGFLGKSTRSGLVAAREESLSKKLAAEREVEREISSAVTSLERFMAELAIQIQAVNGQLAIEETSRELFLLGRASLTDVFDSQEDTLNQGLELSNVLHDQQVAFFKNLYIRQKILKIFERAA